MDETLIPNTLTVVFADCGDAIHVGGPVKYRTVRVALTEEQRKKLARKWHDESIGTAVVEFIDPEPKA